MTKGKIAKLALVTTLVMSPVMTVSAEQLQTDLLPIEQEIMNQMEVSELNLVSEVTDEIGLYDEEAVESQSTAWQSGTPMPTPRYGFGTIVVDEKIYTMGGATYKLGPATGVVEVYDPKTDTWTTAAPMFAPKKCFGIVEINGEIYVFGGGGNLPTDTVQIYNVEEDVWRLAGPMPEVSYDGRAVVLDDKVYIMDTVRRLFYEYDPAEDTWTKKSFLSFQLHRHGLIVYNNDIYSIGGLNTAIRDPDTGGHTQPFYYDDVTKYNVAEDKWEAVPEMDMIFERLEVDAVEKDGKLYVLDASSPDYSAEVYDPETQQWYNLKSMPGTVKR
ncbi:Kelch repeat-containing protein, partial [Longirhabdus pacifica]|uniref:Kelch repeat-containing protein n=1 Tax=Longirhabdus pacifica TaxID=2305227 RepID=UPI0019819465